MITRRRIFLTIIFLAIVLVFLFVRRGRHNDLRSSAIENDWSVLSIREDIAGKETVILGAGTFVAGVDIPPGRYIATTENGFGSFVVYERGTRLPEISEVLGYFAEPAYVPSVALTLVKDQEIKITRLAEVIFTPLKTEFKTELTTGIWEVGLDIKPGTYTISSKDGRGGSFNLFEGDKPVARMELGKNRANSKASGTVTLINGQTIRISAIPIVLFEE